ncbi:hypothetical protein PHSY_003194 [Pseudozyma hubeiensis SY62]|uniref:Uncharacterized protein n=1 Tax=Pseudozyma hubeiensis (strain SY62) TaxID=1305764 RepID=R9P2I8_PSEHS|nr:hypothetical protein PHSY_003194 [Pseudozyma hubeiensis SY62]GAC95618.1 hypothetical protein PHSY_003194 [Pseudozyma hubeiensis SY62]
MHLPDTTLARAVCSYRRPGQSCTFPFDASRTPAERETSIDPKSENRSWYGRYQITHRRDCRAQLGFKSRLAPFRCGGKATFFGSKRALPNRKFWHVDPYKILPTNSRECNQD